MRRHVNILTRNKSFLCLGKHSSALVPSCQTYISIIMAAGGICGRVLLLDRWGYGFLVRWDTCYVVWRHLPSSVWEVLGLDGA